MEIWLASDCRFRSWWRAVYVFCNNKLIQVNVFFLTDNHTYVKSVLCAFSVFPFLNHNWMSSSVISNHWSRHVTGSLSMSTTCQIIFHHYLFWWIYKLDVDIKSKHRTTIILAHITNNNTNKEDIVIEANKGVPDTVHE